MVKRKFINKSDAIVILVIILTSILGYFVYNNMFKNNDNIQAQILVKSKPVYTVSLENDNIFTIEEASKIVFEIKDKKIRFKSSDCPDKICIHSGFLSSTGQVAACLPNKVSIRIISKNNSKSDIDMIT